MDRALCRNFCSVLYNKAGVLILVDGNVEWISVKKFIASFNQVDKRRVDVFADIWKMPDAVTDSLRMYCGEEGYRPGDVCKTISPLKDPRRFLWMNYLTGREGRLYHF